MSNKVSVDKYQAFCRQRTIANFRALKEQIAAQRAEESKELSNTAVLSKENSNVNERQ